MKKFILLLLVLLSSSSYASGNKRQDACDQVMSQIYSRYGKTFVCAIWVRGVPDAIVVGYVPQYGNFNVISNFQVTFPSDSNVLADGGNFLYSVEQVNDLVKVHLLVLKQGMSLEEVAAAQKSLKAQGLRH